MIPQDLFDHWLENMRRLEAFKNLLIARGLATSEEISAFNRAQRDCWAVFYKWKQRVDPEVY